MSLNDGAMDDDRDPWEKPRRSTRGGPDEVRR